MLHNGTKKLFDYWNELKGSRAAPMRVEVSPASISDVLPSTFILQKTDDAPFEFRLAGTSLCLLFGQELKKLHFTSLMDVQERRLVSRLLDAVHSEKVALQLVIHAVSETGRDAYLECLVTPLGDEQPRLLGSMHILDMPYWVGAERLTSLTLSTVRLMDADRDLISLQNRPAIRLSERERARLRRATKPGFSVLQGGAMLGGPQSAQVINRKNRTHLTLVSNNSD